MTIWVLQKVKFYLRSLVKYVDMPTMEANEELVAKKDDFVTFMQNSPLKGMDLIFEKDPSLPRETRL